jgi:hypothetical protein
MVGLAVGLIMGLVVGLAVGGLIVGLMVGLAQGRAHCDLAGAVAGLDHGSRTLLSAACFIISLTSP